MPEFAETPGVDGFDVAAPAIAHVGAFATVAIAEVTYQEISVAEHASAVELRECGAVVTFAGIVRERDQDRAVAELRYEGHPGAAIVLARLIAEAGQTHPAVGAIAASHRLGTLRVGDVALAVAASAPHRGHAFECCMSLVDEIKRRLPVWKHQLFSNGSEEWVNLS